MDRIVLLDNETINKIAAGEVVERPSSIVKELVENSIDAFSSAINIEIKNGGKSYISVSDNGQGISNEDIALVFARHATSKILKADDIYLLDTMGFRGEAMSSISSISDIELFTNSINDKNGSYFHIKGGIEIERKEIGFPTGTTVIVRNLFFNAPARLKFLKGETTEQGYIVDFIEKIALINNSISFKLIIDDKIIFHTPGNGDLLSAIYCLYGKNKSKSMIPINYENTIIKINGYIGKPEMTKGNSTEIVFAVNKRLIKNKMLIEAARQAYKSLIMVNRYPICIFNISLSPDKFDVNVHPSKAEIKFEDDRAIFNTVFTAIKSCLNYQSSFQNFEPEDAKISTEPVKSANQISEVQIPFELNTISASNVSENSIKYNNNYPINDEMNSKKIEYPHTYNASISNLNEAALPDLKVIGQIFNTYILTQSISDFYMIDQHAAHERILFEHLLDKYKNQNIHIQELLLPIIIDLTPKDFNRYMDNISVFNNLGFNIDGFGENTIRISSVPIIMGEPCSGSVFNDILDTLSESKNSIETNKEKIIISLACKNAVKAGDILNIEECSELLLKLKQTNAPYTCPHGRPTVLKMTQLELEKKFKRVL